jgi:hypothetical protein
MDGSYIDKKNQSVIVNNIDISHADNKKRASSVTK